MVFYERKGKGNISGEEYPIRVILRRDRNYAKVQ